MRLNRILPALALVGTALPLAARSGTTLTLQYIKLSLTTHKWSKISAAELSTC